MKIWIVSSLDEENIQGEETIQGRKLLEEIQYVDLKIAKLGPKLFPYQWETLYKMEQKQE